MTKAELYEKAKMLPLLPGVYIIRDKKNEIIYIGKAKRLRIRVSQYFREGVPHDNKVTQMINHAFQFDVIVCQSEFEALVLEASQIKAHTPKYNILLKDDKGYSYVRLTKEPWPRLSAVLQKEEDGAEYIGPYTSSFAVREMVETAQNVFRLPRCNRHFPQDIGKGRPCLNAHIGKCMAVCSGKIRREDYQQAVQGAVRLIRHGKKDIVKGLEQQMMEASDRLDFERAALIRDQITAITKVSAGQKVVVSEDTQMDVIAFAGTSHAVCAAILRYRDGRLTDKREFLFHDTTDLDALREQFLPQYYLGGEEVPRTIAVDALPEAAEALNQALNQARGSAVHLYVPQRGDVAKLVNMAYTNAVERLARESGRYAREEKLLEELAQLLGMEKAPAVIESYDISNWGDGTSVCGMVVFENGKPKRAGYRRFKMRTVDRTDDYASMAEALSRRAAEYARGAAGKFGVLPDLILLDGGRGGDTRSIGGATAVSDVKFRDDRYGVVSRVLVKKTRSGAVSTVDNEPFLARGGSARRVVQVPRYTDYDAMRYTGEYQIAQSKADSVVCTLTVPSLFAAFAGDTVFLHTSPIGLTGRYRVSRSRCWAEAGRYGTELTLAVWEAW